MTQPNQLPVSSHSLDSLLAFYDQANVALRVSLLIVVLWPLTALATAMVLHGSKAETIIPIIDMIPLVAIVFVVIGAPFGLVVLLRFPLAKKGFFFLMGLIGVELSIGLYLAVVPISSDNGLVPLLMLGTMALFFLWVAKFARPLRVLLTIALGVITVIFISGGRPSFSSALKTALTPMTRQNFAAQDLPLFTVSVSSDSWTQEVTLPRAWNTYTLTVNRDFDDPSTEPPWFAYRCSGQSGQLIDTGMAFKAGKPYGSYIFSACSGPVQLRGHANLFFEKGPGTSSATPVPGNDALQQLRPTKSAQPMSEPTTNPEPKEFKPDWSKAQHAQVDELDVLVAPCILRITKLHCFYRVTNYGKQFVAEFYTQSGLESPKVVDEQGNEYLAQAATLGASNDPMHAMTTLPPNVPVIGSVVFDNFKGNAVSYWRIKVRDFNVYNRSLDLEVRDLPVVREGL